MTETLTVNQFKVAYLHVQGYSEKRIAQRLGIAKFTANTYLRTIRSKLDTHDQISMMRLFEREGIIAKGSTPVEGVLIEYSNSHDALQDDVTYNARSERADQVLVS